jgi:pyruvate formate lyase activating enzyme
MKRGLVFDIKEFAVHDGPGIRTTVFLKGCPLKCRWCHNPEGISPQPQALPTSAADRIAGDWYTSQALAALLNQQMAVLEESEGGVTFSGGEPLLQAEFVAETIDQLEGLHVLLDTSGYGAPGAFDMLARRSDLIFFDLKSMQPGVFKRFCGGDLAVVLANLERLRVLGVKVVIRVPLIPGVTDDPANLAAIAESVYDLPGLLRVDLLPYQRLAGAKYPMVERVYDPGFDESQAPRISGGPFDEMGIPWRML